uniref:BTB domain-containing protein n=1 Tax=Panagrolaimus davidi TaxID=227884 RepID=A0A914PNI6_9BILA
MDQNDGYVAICFIGTNFMVGTTIKEMTLSIPSAGFIADLTKVADVPKGHDFEKWEDHFVFKRDDILNPEKKFFVDDILTMEFRGTVEYSKQPESLGETLWKSNSKDFTFIIQKNMKTIMERKVHKYILRQYSSVFREMIDSNVNHFDIDDFDHSAVLAVVKCCYDVLLQGNWRPNVESLLESLRFAIVYDMPIIKERITKHLSGFIDATNVCKIANKSLEYDAPLLKSQCIISFQNVLKIEKPMMMQLI